MNSPRLVRSRSNRMLGGVCGGLGVYLGMDPTWVRLFFILLAITGSLGFWLYVILWIILPNEDESDQRVGFDNFESRARNMGEDIRQAARQPNSMGIRIVGIGLLLVGAYMLVRNLHIPALAFLDKDFLFPLLLIVAGVVLLVRVFRRQD